MRATELRRQNCHPGLHTFRTDADASGDSAEHADIIDYSALQLKEAIQERGDLIPRDLTPGDLTPGDSANGGSIRIPMTSRLKTISLWGTKGLWLSLLFCLLCTGLPLDLRAETCNTEEVVQEVEQASTALWASEDIDAEVSTIQAESSSTRGYWKFNGNLADSSAWGNHASMEGAMFGSGRAGQALMLSGKAGPVVPFADSLSMRTGFSVDLWFKVRGLDQTTTLLGSGTLSSGDYNWAVGIQGGKVQVRYRGEDGLIAGLEYPEKALPLNTWIHLNAWLSLTDGELGLVLADDSVITSQYITVLTVPSLRAQSQTLVIGEGLKGSLDEVRLNAL